MIVYSDVDIFITRILFFTHMRVIPFTYIKFTISSLDILSFVLKKKQLMIFRLREIHFRFKNFTWIINNYLSYLLNISIFISHQKLRKNYAKLNRLYIKRRLSTRAFPPKFICKY